MTEREQNDSGQKSQECLALVRRLREEMKIGLSALATNDLKRFESSVGTQEQLCENVRALAQSDAQPPRTAELAAAGRELRQQNRICLAALVRAAQTCSALLSLYQDSPRGYSPNGQSAVASQTLSCEV